jgi:hypothetical protein
MRVREGGREGGRERNRKERRDEEREENDNSKKGEKVLVTTRKRTLSSLSLSLSLVEEGPRSLIPSKGIKYELNTFATTV